MLWCNKVFLKNSKFNNITGLDENEYVMISTHFLKYNKNNKCKYFEKKFFSKKNEKNFCCDCKYWKILNSTHL